VELRDSPGVADTRAPSGTPTATGAHASGLLQRRRPTASPGPAGSGEANARHRPIARDAIPLVILTGYRDQVQPPSEETEP